MTCLGGAQTLNLTLCDERMQNLLFSLTYSLGVAQIE